MKIKLWLIALAFISMLAGSARAEDEFDAHIFKNKHGKTIPYRLLKPEHYDKSKHYPIVFFLHPYGQHGTDNKEQLKFCVKEFLKPEMREKYPCFVLACQTPDLWVSIPDFKKSLPASEKCSQGLELAVEALDAVVKEYSIDPERVYLSGASNGGYGVWWLLEHGPHRWAAAVPMCGGGDPSAIHVAVHVPIWAFHGDADRTVPIERSREMIAALKEAGGKPKFTEYPKTPHMAAAEKAFKDPELFEWMFAQKR